MKRSRITVILFAAAFTAALAQWDEGETELKFRVALDGKETDATWRARPGQDCALLIPFPFPSKRKGPEKPNPNLPPYPPTRIWLLAADGTVISPSGAPIAPRISTGLGGATILIYSFPESARSNAVAVVVNVATNFTVQSLLTPKPSPPP